MTTARNSKDTNNSWKSKKVSAADSGYLYVPEECPKFKKNSNVMRGEIISICINGESFEVSCTLMHSALIKDTRACCIIEDNTDGCLGDVGYFADTVYQLTSVSEYDDKTLYDEDSWAAYIHVETDPTNSRNEEECMRCILEHVITEFHPGVVVVNESLKPLFDKLILEITPRATSVQYQEEDDCYIFVLYNINRFLDTPAAVALGSDDIAPVLNYVSKGNDDEDEPGEDYE